MAPGSEAARAEAGADAARRGPAAGGVSLAFFSSICSELWRLTFQILNAMFVLGCPEHVPLVPESQEADELIIGLPVSADGRETPQSNKVRSVVGRLAVQAAERFVACVQSPNFSGRCFWSLVRVLQHRQ
jgi:hypothetical protein